MIQGLKPYTEYKESGQPWVGKTPAHWDLVPNRGLVKKRKVLVGKRHREYQLLSLTKQGVIVRDISTGKGKFSADMGTSQEVRIGDFVFCLFDVPETPRAVGLSRHQGMITGAYTVLEFLGRGNANYFEKFYLAMDDRKLLSPLYSGLRHTIPIERLLGAKTPLPPPDEQAAIVKFLDHANGKIERAIRAKRKLIGLLNEQKQAIIHRAVTRGLDPNVKLKPSGIPWLGDVPEHWEVRAFARMSRVVRGSSPRPAGDKRFFNGDIMPWVTVGEVTKDREMYLRSTETCLTQMGVERSTTFPAGTLILTNSGATLGVPKILGINACANDGIVAFIGLHSVVKKPFAYLFLSMLTQRLRDEMRQGGTQPNLNTGIVRRIVCPVPPFAEQEAILQFVEQASVPLSTAVSRTEREIELLREYRTTLTAEVVTGKLDVREAAKRLPDEAVELLPADESLDDMVDDEIAEEVEA